MLLQRREVLVQVLLQQMPVDLLIAMLARNLALILVLIRLQHREVLVQVLLRQKQIPVYLLITMLARNAALILVLILLQR